MIRAVLFDLDETLIDRAETMRKFLQDQYHRFPDLSVNAVDLFVDACLNYQNNGYADKHLAYKSACDDFGSKNLILADLLFEDFKEHYGKDPVLFPGVVETLGTLRKNYLLGLVSNGRSRAQVAKLEVSGISELFSSICISESIGSKKPDHSIFLYCLNELLQLLQKFR